ncbi:MAG: hypothetical protein IJG61_01405 [Lachnospiraceae bacterium]|nr:hypothetical protein [Lachnospiraceae bacterium]
MRSFKKVILLAAACVMMLAAAACGSRREDAPAPETQAQTQQAETERQTEAPETQAPETQAPETEIEAGTQAPAPSGASADNGSFPAEAAGVYYFSSGAGGWGTEVTLNADGTFEGYFHDSDMGDTGEGYPNGTFYFCEFNGRFANVRRDNDTTWSMTLEELNVTSGFDYEAYIEDGVRHVPSNPYGFEAEPGTTFYIYSPDHPAAGMSEEFLRWIEPRLYADPQPEGLSVYVIHNTTGDYGFYQASAD